MVPPARMWAIKQASKSPSTKVCQNMQNHLLPFYTCLAAFKESLLLQQLKEGEHFNLVCKVTEDESILFVWDGSDAPQRQIHSKLENEEAYPLRLQLEPQTLPRDILCTFPTVGTVLRVFVNQRNVQLNLSSLTMGRWVKLINLKFEVHEGVWCGVLMSSSKVRFLPNEDQLVLERQRLVLCFCLRA
ncbi:hypothetical protein Cgig2_008693 [Carnegiea gigantea]|uniref:Uncharacterized protein n=1 Tax=Carnegiea gigantea TaxID=171969 RepID=A0A9Q1JMP7_9CARY|nr:hypothetical protein Cgig2_008693 [Carnegiea gigantea]